MRRNDQERGEPRAEPSATNNALTGSAGNVVQAREVGGGIHVYGALHSAAPPSPAQLPGDVRGFVNRTDELRSLATLLDTPLQTQPAATALRIAVVVGTAGVGKTSLAIRWAHQIKSQFPDGQLYANLRNYNPGPPMSANDVLGRFLRALDVPKEYIPTDEESRAELFRSVTADRRVLVLLDNAATAGEVRPLLPGSSSCLVTITSRTRMSGLVAREGAHRVSVETLSQDESIRLLRAVIDGYRAGDDDSELAELARLCAHLPLALRIVAERAAARPRMPLRDLISDLRDESGLWDALSATAEGESDEADAVRTVFAWSYRALTPQTARLFRLLGLHPGAEFGAGAVAALLGTDPARVRRSLDGLAGAHLLEECGHDRYQFHDLLRAYAVDQAQREESPEERRAALGRVLGWYAHSAAAAARVGACAYTLPLSLVPLDEGVEPMSFEDAKAAVAWYEEERDNLIASVRSAEAAGMGQVAWQIPAVLTMVIADREPADAWLPAQQTALEAARHADDRYGEAVTLDTLGIAHRRRFRLAEAEECFAAALRIFDELGDGAGQAHAANGLGVTRLFAHRVEEAASCFEQALRHAHELADALYVGAFTRNLGWARLESGDLDEAETLLGRAASTLAEAGEPLEQAEALTLLAAVHRQAGRLNSAVQTAELALSLADEADGTLFEALALHELGRIALAQEDGTEALGHLQQAATLFQRSGRPDLQAAAWDTTGEALLELGRSDEAVAFHRRAAAVFQGTDDQRSLARAMEHVETASARVEE